MTRRQWAAVLVLPGVFWTAGRSSMPAKPPALTDTCRSALTEAATELGIFQANVRELQDHRPAHVAAVEPTRYYALKAECER